LKKSKPYNFGYRGTVDGRVLSHCFMTFERFDVKIIIKKSWAKKIDENKRFVRK